MASLFEGFTSFGKGGNPSLEPLFTILFISSFGQSVNFPVAKIN